MRTLIRTAFEYPARERFLRVWRARIVIVTVPYAVLSVVILALKAFTYV